NVRYMQDFRTDLESLGRVLVSASGGQIQAPLAQLATIKTATGPTMLRSEDGMLAGYVYLDIEGRDLSSYIAEAGRLIRVQLPAGYAVSWSGQWEAMERVKQRLTVVVPLTLFLIFLLLYLNTRSVNNTLTVLLAAPF